MNPRLQDLEPYPFTKLRALFDGITPPEDRCTISLGVGEPRHESPAFVLEAIADNLDLLAKYPSTPGMPELRHSIAQWLQRRFQLSGIDSELQVLPVNGTREALFAFAQAVVHADEQALVMSPNPFYQIYEGAALLAGARPRFINCTAATGFLPDFDGVSSEEWQRCQLLYLCSPGNPTGAVLSLQQLQQLIQLSREHDFVIASDECYSEIYFDEDTPPPGLLQACAVMGEHDYRNCVVFHSLSKRSNLPGLRSGFVAGDADILQRFLEYRTYHGCAMPLHHQIGSIAAWSDEAHVIENRSLYRSKFKSVLPILEPALSVELPQAGFYLWPRTPIADTEFAQELYRREGITVLPGRFLARQSASLNPGVNHIRMALVASQDDCLDAARRIVRCLNSLGS